MWVHVNAYFLGWTIKSKNVKGEGKICWICQIREIQPNWRPGVAITNELRRQINNRHLEIGGTSEMSSEKHIYSVAGEDFFVASSVEDAYAKWKKYMFDVVGEKEEDIEEYEVSLEDVNQLPDDYKFTITNCENGKKYMKTCAEWCAEEEVDESGLIASYNMC